MKSVLILIAIFFLVLAVRRALETKRARRAEDASATRDAGINVRAESEEMVLDTVCGSYVPISSAIKTSEGGRAVFFCSEECRKKSGAGAQ